jgi:S-adenosylmethionine-diacylgycerolhomoserine-N-methlytransferase
MTAGSESQRILMDGVYRYQRHVYDLSRRNYLLGRDRLIAELDPPPRGSVLEVGCGTGRNLVALARRHPDIRLYGIDISPEMLRTARRTVARHGVYDRIRLAEADAVSMDPFALFGIERVDRVFFSYTLSMIPDWRGALVKGASLLAPGGKLQFVDFGRCEGWPESFRKGLYKWLALFHVSPRLALPEELAMLGRQLSGQVRTDSLYRGYALAGSLAIAPQNG